MKTSSKILVYILSLLQIILSFILGVFGNKLSELIKVNEQVLFFGIITTILFLLIVTIILLNYQNGTPLSFPKSDIFTSGKPLITAFPFAVVLGAIVQFVSLALFREQPIYMYPSLPILFNYEILPAVIAFLTIFIFRALRHDIVLMIIYCLGLGTGISGTLLLLRPYEHSYFYTLTGWYLYLLAIALVSRSEKIRHYLSTTYQALTQEHK